MEKKKMRRWFWIGIWLIPFGLLATVGTYAIAFLMFGAGSVAVERSRLGIGVLILILTVIWVISLMGHGWAADQAVKRVKR